VSKATGSVLALSLAVHLGTGTAFASHELSYSGSLEEQPPLRMAVSWSGFARRLVSPYQ